MIDRKMLNKLIISSTFWFLALIIIGGCAGKVISKRNSAPDPREAIGTKVNPPSEQSSSSESIIPDEDQTSGIFFVAAQNIIENKCQNCHASNNTIQNFPTEESEYFDFFVVEKDIEKSPIYNRLIGSSSDHTTMAQKNMPPGKALTEQEIKVITTWISASSAPKPPGSPSADVPTQPIVKLSTIVSILDRYQCLSCHETGADRPIFSREMNVDQFIQKGLVVPGSVFHSSLYQSMKEHGTNPRFEHTMPKNRPAITLKDAKALSDWITTISTEGVYFKLSTSTPTVSEVNGRSKVIIERLGDISNPLSIQLAASGSASTIDYSMATTATFAANSAYAEVILLAVNDNLVEGIETVNITLVSQGRLIKGFESVEIRILESAPRSEVMAILESSCALSGCHLASTLSQAPEFSSSWSDAQFVSSTLISPGEPENSPLIQSIQYLMSEPWARGSMPRGANSSNFSYQDAQKILGWVLSLPRDDVNRIRATLPLSSLTGEQTTNLQNNATYTVELYRSRSNEELTVDLLAVPGAARPQAIQNIDFTIPTSVTFMPGKSRATFEINVTQNELGEPREYFGLNFLAPDGAQVFKNATIDKLSIFP